MRIEDYNFTIGNDGDTANPALTGYIDELKFIIGPTTTSASVWVEDSSDGIVWNKLDDTVTTLTADATSIKFSPWNTTTKKYLPLRSSVRVVGDGSSGSADIVAIHLIQEE